MSMFAGKRTAGKWEIVSERTSGQRQPVPVQVIDKAGKFGETSLMQVNRMKHMSDLLSQDQANLTASIRSLEVHLREQSGGQK